jgi:hypothetical protein
MGRAGADCRRHRAALIAFAAHREAVAETRSALAHVDRCRACAEELQELVLAVIALRRLGELPEAAAISAAAWPRLRGRIERSRASAAAVAWRWRTTMAGMAAGTLMVAALVAPMALHIPIGTTGGEPVGYTADELDRSSRRIERQYMFESRVGTLAPASSSVTSRTTGSQGTIPKRYPDGIAPEAKEVDPKPIGRPLIVD